MSNNENLFDPAKIEALKANPSDIGAALSGDIEAARRVLTLSPEEAALLNAGTRDTAEWPQVKKRMDARYEFYMQLPKNVRDELVVESFSKTIMAHEQPTLKALMQPWIQRKSDELNEKVKTLVARAEQELTSAKNAVREQLEASLPPAKEALSKSIDTLVDSINTALSKKDEPPVQQSNSAIFGNPLYCAVTANGQKRMEELVAAGHARPLDLNTPAGVPEAATMVPTFEHNYLGLMKHIVEHGAVKGDRTGTGTRSLFGTRMEFDISGGKLPLMTTKELFYKNMALELEWFISGSTDIEFLKKNGINIWDSWVKPETARFVSVDFMNERYDWGRKVQQTVHDKLTWLRCYEPRLWKMWQRREAVYHAGLVDGSNKKSIATRFNEFWVMAGEAFAAVTDTLPELPNKILAGGSIGDMAYGALWRKWEDIRVIKESEYERYQAHGYYTMLGTLENSVPNGDKHIVVRRNVDQLKELVKGLIYNPDSRRHIVSAWNPARLYDAVLPPCHSFFQFNSYQVPGKEKRQLELQLYQRSADMAVGVPFNVAQYPLLAHVIAALTNHEAVRFVWIGGDTHVYENHLHLLQEQLGRDVRPHTARVQVNLDVHSKWEDVTADRMVITGYDDHHPPLFYPVAV